MSRARLQPPAVLATWLLAVALFAAVLSQLTRLPDPRHGFSLDSLAAHEAELAALTDETDRTRVIVLANSLTYRGLQSGRRLEEALESRGVRAAVVLIAPDGMREAVDYATVEPAIERARPDFLVVQAEILTHQAWTSRARFAGRLNLSALLRGYPVVKKARSPPDAPCVSAIDAAAAAGMARTLGRAYAEHRRLSRGTQDLLAAMAEAHSTVIVLGMPRTRRVAELVEPEVASWYEALGTMTGGGQRILPLRFPGTLGNDLFCDESHLSPGGSDRVVNWLAAELAELITSAGPA